MRAADSFVMLLIARLPESAAGTYVKTMPKRMLLQFGERGFPSYDLVDEQGMPQPCALGVPWVHEDTRRTLARLRIPRTDPWGRLLAEGGSGAEVRGARYPSAT